MLTSTKTGEPMLAIIAIQFGNQKTSRQLYEDYTSVAFNEY